jgi:Ca-activated chloride channel family protein
MPERSSEAFAITTSAVPTPWNPETRLLHIGIQGREVPQDETAPLNLVFLVDVSGSMDSPDKLPLVQQSLLMMLDGLSDRDTVGIVTYAGNAGIALRPTPVSDREEIERAIEDLSAGGSTAGAEGISTAYELIEDYREDHDDRGRAIDRVILATDGDFNVGISDPDALVDFIAEKRDEGIYLSVLGYGTGNLHDSTMQALAQNGNGNAAYIDSMREARKVLVEDLRRTVVPIADDVKIQVEFDPRTVRTWRLIGYETRPLDTEDFENDRVDAGEIGSGHQVTAIYEIEPAGRLASGFADVRLRWKAPGERESRLIERAVTGGDLYDSFAAAPQETRFAIAVAAFGQLLRGNEAMEGTDFGDVATWAGRALGSDPSGRRHEFVELAEIAGSVAPTD